MTCGRANGVRVGISAIVPAFVSAATWVCCLPFALGPLSASSAAFGVALSPLRPYLNAVALTCLAAGFYKTYRPRARCSMPSRCSAERSLLGAAVLWTSAIVTLGLLTIERWSSYVILWFL